jgi:GntR family transcriptional regulator
LVPSEAELGKQYGISRITVRAALDNLSKAGLLERQVGRGTFVRASGEELWGCISSFTEQMLRAGRMPKTRLLKLEVQRDVPELSKALGLGAKEELVFIERLRLVDGQPAALVRTYIPHRFVPGISRKHFAPTGQEQSILYVLERHFGLILDEGEETTVPVCLVHPEAGLLGLKEGSPVIAKSCLIHNNQGEPLLLEQAYWCVPQTELVRRVGVMG